MSAKLFLDSSIKWIPQMDVSVKFTENGGVEGSQGFLARKADIGAGPTLNAFTRGTTWENLYPDVPEIFRHLKMKTFDPVDYAPGISLIKGTFTGYQYTGSGGSGSSGEEKSVATSSLRGTHQPLPLRRHPKWEALATDIKGALGKLLKGQYELNVDGTSPGVWDHDHVFFTNAKKTDGSFIIFTGDALLFARMIAEGETTYDHPSWTYIYRTESQTGFTAAQLDLLGKIVTPLGDPMKPSSKWIWQLLGPEQEQSGPERFAKELAYKLIENSPTNQMLYTP